MKINESIWQQLHWFLVGTVPIEIILDYANILLDHALSIECYHFSFSLPRKQHVQWNLFNFPDQNPTKKKVPFWSMMQQFLVGNRIKMLILKEFSSNRPVGCIFLCKTVSCKSILFVHNISSWLFVSTILLFVCFYAFTFWLWTQFNDKKILHWNN